MIICARNGCENKYERKTHNQKYCCDECCRLATNERIMQKYHEGRARVKGQVRWCIVCDKTKLSRYNDSRVCASCKSKKEADANRAAVDMLLNASLAS